MKKQIQLLVLILFTSSLMVSCIFEDTTNTFDETLLYGKWQSGTLYYNYVADGSGTTWDTSDDVTEAEAQSFTWTLISSDLTHIYTLEIGGNVPKVYKVTKLTSSTLTYEDDFGTSYTFIKISKQLTAAIV